jgi:hypothetical protein
VTLVRHRALRALVAASALWVGSPGFGIEVLETSDVAPVWSGHPVTFCLLTARGWQVAAFFDADRDLTVASRRVPEGEWTLARLPRRTGWDSHNALVMAVDGDGHLHLTGDMHCVPLIYFRTRHPLDRPLTSESFEPLHRMTGAHEERVTYPVFLRGADDALVFMYRDGRSGDGIQIFDRYDLPTKTWHALLDRPLTSAGRSDRSMNAYFHGPVRGPDDLFHMVWVWRDTPDCETCHDVCYARSRDLVHWERSDGTPLDLPITPESCEYVDRVAPGGGVINGLVKIGFDADARPIVSYHKYDAAGNSQIMNARLEGGRWTSHQASDWKNRWSFAGPGTIGFDIGVGPVTVEADGSLAQDYRNRVAGGGTWRLDPRTLAASGTTVRPPRHPRQMGRPESLHPGMTVKWADDAGVSEETGTRYLLRWETLGPNRDQPRPQPWPEPTMLRVLKFRD